MTIGIRDAREADWPAIGAILEAGIATGDATFETTPPGWETWNARHLASPRLVAVTGDQGKVVGWGALSRVSVRPGYAGVAEVSVYVDERARGRGVGRVLLLALAEASEDAGFWTLQASIFPENAASLALHARCGFRVLGRRCRVGVRDGLWRDVMLLERRSTRVGV